LRSIAQCRIHESGCCGSTFADGSFDVVTVTQCLCLVSDVAAAIREISRVLRPGGRAVTLETDWDALVWKSSEPRLTDKVMGISISKAIMQLPHPTSRTRSPGRRSRAAPHIQRPCNLFLFCRQFLIVARGSSSALPSCREEVDAHQLSSPPSRKLSRKRCSRQSCDTEEIRRTSIR
jgi:SAM-dependent methyltransferase